MQPNFILRFPREIRDKIYIYALSSPTGYVLPTQRFDDLKHFALLPFKPPNCIYPGRIRLSLLQTCKQINHEAKDVLVFKHNTWVFSIYDLPWAIGGLDVKISHRMQHVWLSYNLTNRSGLEDTFKSLEILSGWAQEAGNLRTVTLGVVAGMQDMHELMELRLFGEPEDLPNGEFNPDVGKKLFGEYLTVLRDSWGKHDAQWAGITKRLELRVNRLNDSHVYEPREMVKEMHDAFGGELWVDGRLCYKDGKEILQPFKWAVYGNWQVAWFREGESAIWGTEIAFG